MSKPARLSLNNFGLLRMLEPPGLTLTGEFVGTLAHMSAGRDLEVVRHPPAIKGAGEKLELTGPVRGSVMIRYAHQ